MEGGTKAARDEDAGVHLRKDDLRDAANGRRCDNIKPKRQISPLDDFSCTALNAL